MKQKEKASVHPLNVQHSVDRQIKRFQNCSPSNEQRVTDKDSLFTHDY